MRRLVVLGAGTAGTMVVNKLRRALSRDEWSIAVVDVDDRHLYQPGLLLLPFGVYRPEELVRSRHHFVPDGVELVEAEVEHVDREAREVRLAGGRRLPYDYLVVATGTSPRPDQTPGMLGPEWGRSVHEFYTLDGAVALRDALARFDRGRLVVHITEMPIKCPVAPLELAFLADAHFEERGTRSSVDITYVTPLDGAFTRRSRRSGSAGC
jgi:sulfide:quinone oxidoreductase